MHGEAVVAKSFRLLQKLIVVAAQQAVRGFVLFDAREAFLGNQEDVVVVVVVHDGHFADHDQPRSFNAQNS